MFEILVATLIFKKNKVLLVKEKKDGIEGKLNLPAGHLEPGETLMQGACREVFEETGLRVETTRLIDVQYFKHKETSCVSFVFKGKIKDETKAGENELNYDFYDIDFVKEHEESLRNSTLILAAIEKSKGGSKKAVKVLK